MFIPRHAYINSKVENETTTTKKRKKEILSKYEPRESRCENMSMSIKQNRVWGKPAPSDTQARVLIDHTSPTSLCGHLITLGKLAGRVSTQKAELGFPAAHFGQSLSHTLTFVISQPRDLFFSNDVSLERGIQENHLVNQ